MGNETRQCKGCGVTRPIAEFYRALPHQPARKIAAKNCYRCRDEASLLECYNQVWSWDKALRKATAMHVTKLRTDGEWTGRVEAGTIRGLFEYQEGRCMLLRIPFIVPAPTCMLQPNTTLQGWVESAGISERDQECLPVLVRATAQPDWIPGNVVLVSALAERIYRFAGTLIDAHYLIKRTDVPVIPTEETIVHYTRQADTKLYNQCRSWLEQLRNQLRGQRKADEDEGLCADLS